MWWAWILVYITATMNLYLVLSSFLYLGNFTTDADDLSTEPAMVPVVPYHTHTFNVELDVRVPILTVNHEQIQLQQQWEQYKVDFGKKYHNEREERHRLSIFQKNSMMIEGHNKLYAQGFYTYELGHNQFSDITHQEYLERHTSHIHEQKRDWVGSNKRHNEEPTVRQPRHNDEPAVKQPRYNDEPTNIEPNYNEQPTVRQLKYNDEPTFRQPRFNDEHEPSVKQPIIDNGPTVKQPIYDEQPTVRQLKYNDEPVFRQPKYNDELIVKQPIINDEPSVKQPINDDQPTVTQLKYNDEPAFRQPRYNDEPTVKQPIIDDGPTVKQPKYDEQPTVRHLKYNDEPTFRQPRYNDESTVKQPKYNNKPTFREPRYDDEISEDSRENLPEITYIPPTNVTLPSSIDWRHKGAVTSVKNEGICAASWAFSAIGALEGQHFRKTNDLDSLSEQNLVDCSRGSTFGCVYGTAKQAYGYIFNNNGINTEFQYPWRSSMSWMCHYKCYSSNARVSALARIKRGSEEDLRSAVANIGPIAVSVDASHPKFKQYKSGVFNELSCNPNRLNRELLVVGYEKSFWIVKNSWGKRWGVGGYFFLAKDRGNQCGIASKAMFPVV